MSEATDPELLQVPIAGDQVEISRDENAASLQQHTSTGIGDQLLRSKTLTPRDYARAVQAHSEQSTSDSLYPGPNFANLASYLGAPYHRHAPRISNERTTPNRSHEQPDFASYYHLKRGGTNHHQYVQRPEDLRLIENQSTASDDIRGNVECVDNDAPSGNLEGRLLFLRGNASPEWLNHVGATYNVDPEFFLRHRNFATTTGRPNYFSLPSLPSTNVNMIRLRITTIGSRIARGGWDKPLSQKELDALRKESKATLSKYFDSLSKSLGSNTVLGESHVRDFSLHSSDHFSIEQDISICISKAPNGWIAIVWSDVGHDLDSSTQGPWSTEPFRTKSWQTDTFPTIQHRPGIALRRYRVHRPRAPTTGSPIPRSNNNTQQSASLLHLDFGRKLKPDIMAQDPFYALHDIFRFSAFTTAQLLNLIQSKIQLELDHSALIDLERQTVSNVVYNRRILERHVSYLKEVLMFVETRVDGYWPIHPDPDKLALVAINRLIIDFKYLLAKAEDLIKECDTGVDIIAHNAMTQEAQSALKQTQGVVKLTKLAFVFVPLSFTSSFFGMNMREFGTSTSIELTTWLATSVPIVLISVLFMMFNISQMAKSVPKFFTKQKFKFGRVANDRAKQELDADA